jgi:hypothetical protein
MTAYVVTFYSFKGGVGRTTLLVNVAQVLAAQDERVLIWDLDLEAPGIHYFPGLESPEPIWQAGFLEWLGDMPRCPTAEPTADWPDPGALKTLGDRVYEARDPRGRIFILPAHGTNAKLGHAYGRVDWHGLFAEHPAQGLHLFEQARDALIERFAPAYLFIDSRTGITDLGGFLTALVPDCTVLVGNYSRQSTEGLRSVYLALDRFATERVKAETRRERKLERVLVASPVPSSLSVRERGRKRWTDGFPGEAPRSLIEVPLVENLLYAEDVLVRSAPSSDAAKAYRLVAERLAALRQIRLRSEPPPTPAELTPGTSRVERLLVLLGFEISRGADADLLARQTLALGGTMTYAVAYLGGTARSDDRFRRLLDRLRRSAGTEARLLMIADEARPNAHDAARAAGAELRTISELENQLVDLRACATAVRRDFEDSELSRSYVAPRAVRPDGQTIDALAYAMAWMSGGRSQLLLVRGDPGIGKTGFLRRLAYEIAGRIDQDPATPVPLLIRLRDAPTSVTLDGLLQLHLRTLIGWHGNPEALLYLLHAGRLILLLDGFDELTVSSRDAAEEQLRILTRPTEQPGATPSANRMIVSSRSNSAVPLRASTRLDADAIDLSPFDDEQAREFLSHRLGAERAPSLPFALVQLQALSPFLLELIAGAAPELSGPATEFQTADLFERYIAAWIAGPQQDGLSPPQRARLIERLAAELWKIGSRELPHELFASAVKSSEPSLAALSAAEIDLVLRAAPFVTRSEAGAYGFSHRSILEYVLACHLVEQALRGPDALRAALATEPLDTTCTSLFVELADRRPFDPEAVRRIVEGPYTSGATENAVRIAAAFDAQALAGTPR